MELPSEESLQEEERSLSIEMSRADRAAQVFENEIFQEAVQAVRQRCFDQFAVSPLDDDKVRYHARLSLGLLEGLLRDLRTVMETGKLAEMRKAEINEQRRYRDAEPGETTWQ